MRKHLPALVSTCLIIAPNLMASIQTQQPQKTEEILVEDPLFSAEAPPRITFRTIKVVHQPVPPRYPEIARERGIQGDVLVEVWINESGIPTRSELIWGPKELASATTKFCLTWRFEPYQLNGKPSPARFRIFMPFRLSNGGPIQRIPTLFKF